MSRHLSEQRAKILRSAIRVFAEHGVDSATVRMVGEAAEVNSALIYYYFENKQTLYLEAVRQVVLDLLGEIERGLHPFAGPGDRIRFLVEAVFHYYGAYPERMKLMGTVHTQHAEILGRVIQRIFEEAVPAPLRVLREGIERGELRRLHPAHIWWTVLGACVFCLHAHQTLRVIDPRVLPFPMPTLEQGRRDIVALLCEGLALPGRSKRSKSPRSRK
jgi:TetR/AcrR family transcriptional regulator